MDFPERATAALDDLAARVGLRTIFGTRDRVRREAEERAAVLEGERQDRIARTRGELVAARAQATASAHALDSTLETFDACLHAPAGQSDEHAVQRARQQSRTAAERARSASARHDRALQALATFPDLNDELCREKRDVVDLKTPLARWRELEDEYLELEREAGRRERRKALEAGWGDAVRIERTREAVEAVLCWLTEGKTGEPPIGTHFGAGLTDALLNNSQAVVAAQAGWVISASAGDRVLLWSINRSGLLCCDAMETLGAAQAAIDERLDRAADAVDALGAGFREVDRQLAEGHRISTRERLPEFDAAIGAIESAWPAVDATHARRLLRLVREALELLGNPTTAGAAELLKAIEPESRDLPALTAELRRLGTAAPRPPSAPRLAPPSRMRPSRPSDTGLASCEWCGELWHESALDSDGCCPRCADPDMREFERAYQEHLDSYYPASEREVAYDGEQVASSYDEACPRCGQETDRLIGVTHRNGETRYVCEDCRGDALSGDRSFWHWFHKE